MVVFEWKYQTNYYVVDYIKDTKDTAEAAIKGFQPVMKLDKTFYDGISTFLKGERETLFNRVLWGLTISLV